MLEGRCVHHIKALASWSRLRIALKSNSLRYTRQMQTSRQSKAKLSGGTKCCRKTVTSVASLLVYQSKPLQELLQDNLLVKAKRQQGEPKAKPQLKTYWVSSKFLSSFNLPSITLKTFLSSFFHLLTNLLLFSTDKPRRDNGSFVYTTTVQLRTTTPLTVILIYTTTILLRYNYAFDSY